MVEFGSGEELMTGDFLEALNDNEEKAVRNPDRLSSLLLSLFFFAVGMVWLDGAVCKHSTSWSAD